MSLRAVLMVDAECPPCDEAEEAMRKYIQAEEVEVMDIREGLRQFDLGNPEGVPFVAYISPSTGKCVNKQFFYEAGGEVLIQPSPSTAEVEGAGEAEKEAGGGEIDQGGTGEGGGEGDGGAPPGEEGPS